MASASKVLLRQPSFRALLGTRLCIVLANQIASVAIGWRIYELTKSPLWLGYVGLAEAIPAILFALFAGHFADNRSRKNLVRNSVYLLLASLLLRTLISYGSESFNTSIQLVILFGTVIMDGVSRAFFGPAYFGLQAEVVPKAQLPDAASLISGMWQIAAVIGPALGGLLYGMVGPGPTFAISLVLVMVCLFVIRLIPRNPPPKPEIKLSVLTSIREGLNFVFSSQIMLGAITLDLFAVLFGGAVALLPAFSDQILNTGSTGLGLLRAAPAFGSVLMATFMFRKKINAGHYGHTLLIVVAGFGLCMVAFGLSDNFWLSLFVLSLSGAFDHVSITIRQTIAQVYTPDALRGRVSAVNSIFIISSNEIGEFESGVTAQWWGIKQSVVAGGLMSLLVVALVAIKAPRLRKLKSPGLE